MFRQWIAQGVTLEDVEDAAATAEARLNGYPSNPTYYRGFVAEVVLEKQRAKENPAATGNSKPGIFESQNDRNWRQQYGKIGHLVNANLVQRSVNSTYSENSSGCIQGAMQASSTSQSNVRELTDKLITRLWTKMAQIYGHRWVSIVLWKLQR